MINKKKIASMILLLCVPAVVYFVFFMLQPARFGSVNSLFILFQQCLLPTVTACGYYFIITMGLFDFSIGSNIVLSSIVGGLLSIRFGYMGLFLGGIAVGALIGLINGLMFVKLRISSIIVTVGMMMLYECLGLFISGGGIFTLDKSVKLFGTAPYNVIVSILAMGLSYILIDHTRVGVYVKSIGSNESISRDMGIRVDKYKVVGFVICGLFAGIAGVLTISYSSSISPMLNMNSMERNFMPMMGCFVGMALKKYINPIIAIVIGEFTISLLINGLMTNGIDATLQKMVTGLFLLLIVGFTTRTSKARVVK